MRQGVLTANFASASGFDTTDILSVNLTMSAGTLSGTTTINAQNGGTLCLVDSELISYQTATLTSAYNYNITNIQRAMYGTQAALHTSGTNFWRLDSSILKSVLTTPYIGQTLYFKFQSINVWGSGVQALSSCTVYSYTPTGLGAIGPVTQTLLVGTSMDWGNFQTMTQNDDWGNETTVVIASVDLGGVTTGS